MDVVQLKCPNCGGSIEFDPKTQKYLCEYCMSDFTQEEIEQIKGIDETEENSYNIPNQQEQDEFNNNTNLYICDNCGAEVICDENTAATFCYYCHSPVALKGRLSGECRPELVIPFKYTREQTLQMYKDWCKKKWFLPSDFTSAQQLEKITGLYVPFWLADCKVNAQTGGEGRIVTTHTQGDYRITHTKVFDVQRGATMEYRGVPADASKKLDDRLMDSIEPFDYKDFVPFSMNYLSGFFADKYDVSKAEILPRIKQRVEQGSQDVLTNDIVGYTSFVPATKRTQIIHTTWHYTMLPVWFMSYKYRGKDYFFGMNGQTGKISGILPLSVGKVAALAACLLVVIGGIAGLIGGAVV